jgi:haloalkane dehalogenase
MPTELASQYPAAKQRVAVRGLEMAYIELGSGDPIVFLHGNPTSSYLWRNVMPHLAEQGRCIAPDLIGMGDSDKLSTPAVFSYTYAQHRRYLDGFFDAVVPEGALTLVVHDWGSALGFDWARRHPERVRAVAYLEAIVMPIEWSDFPEGFRPVFQALRSPAGEAMVLEQNLFVEEILPAAIQRKLDDAAMEVYRAPYREPGESRRPTLTWPRQLPIAGEPADVVESIEANGAFMAAADFPKLFINADPGAILVGRARDFCRTWPNQQETTLPGIHFLQEDVPHEIGATTSEWLRRLSGGSG